jgi:pimeloyl-ACP methyl ester carboxylesterase
VKRDDPALQTAASPADDAWRPLRQSVLALQRQLVHSAEARRFDYVHPVRLQSEVPPRMRKAYAVPAAYLSWGAPDAPLVVCTGGVANCAERFTALAEALAADHHMVALDWVGRGASGWLAHESEYSFETYVEQLLQLLDHLGAPPAALIGSSLGGSVAIELASRWPQRVRALVLNDIGPCIPRARRTRRADALARFYVFRTPQELMQRVGASQKHDGRISEAWRTFLSWHATRWSDENQGRIYRHDPRAMTAYQRQAQSSFEQWSSWSRVGAPVMLLHGLASDALDSLTIDRMRVDRPLTVAHLPDTGHAPSLCDPAQVQCIARWLRHREAPASDFVLP